MFDSLQPHWLQHARLPCLSPTPRDYSNSCPLPRRSALFNTSAWNKSCHCTWGHSLWGPAFSLPTTHGGPCLWGAWPVWLWSGAFLRPSLGEPVVLMHTPSLRAVVLRPYSTSCLHLCPLFVCGWSTAVPISFALRAGNLGQPSTSHRWEKR